ncbi:Sec-independent protein translocase protein TatAy [Planctomycetes bacterium Poly30]|uniref:Sec-independent protein translocase protein TatAy n=1 Tax=Saltatorellus ferox TaxID=2528018 RepID=A0A518ESQ5_9BACT|nr:Sec-independent protein translocase protein TatAy [Planctomycetes bacterium Poly30]
MNILNLIGLITSPSLRAFQPWDGSDAAREPMLALPGVAEWWPILIVVVLLFGARKLPELARAMGTSVTQFRKGLENPEEEDKKSIDGKSEQPGE